MKNIEKLSRKEIEEIVQERKKVKVVSKKKKS